MKKFFFVSIMFLSFLYAQKTVTVSIVPQKYFVEKIAKEKIAVNVMVQPGFSPATYEPKTSQMRDLLSSDIYFSIGVPFEESWLSIF
jgi:zinc transport system substrate-binding protein